MKVRVPKLNPLVFTKSGEYNVYDDAALKEQLFEYVQLPPARQLIGLHFNISGIKYQLTQN